MNPAHIGRAPEHLARREYGCGRRRAPRHSEIKTGLGRRIRQAVRDRYGSQQRAALAWGCSQNYVSRIERELSAPEPWMLRDLGLE